MKSIVFGLPLSDLRNVSMGKIKLPTIIFALTVALASTANSGSALAAQPHNHTVQYCKAHFGKKCVSAGHGCFMSLGSCYGTCSNGAECFAAAGGGCACGSMR
jgi:hypothetical protein